MKTIKLLIGLFLLLMSSSCVREATTIDADFLEEIILLEDDVKELEINDETCYVYLKKNSLTKPVHQQASNGIKGPHYKLNLSNQQNDLFSFLTTYEVHYSKPLPIRYSDSRFGFLTI